MKEWISKDKFFLFSALFFVAAGIFISVLWNRFSDVLHEERKKVEVAYDSISKVTKIVSQDDARYRELKELNDKLVDSVMKLSDVDGVIRYKYVYRYQTDTVFVSECPESGCDPEVYEYRSESDSVSYSVKIASCCEPRWYGFGVELNDDFIIVQKKDNGFTETDIKTEYGDIEGAIAVSRPEKRGFLGRICYGPTISVGYDPAFGGFHPVIGFGVTFDLKKR